ncbi:hydrolase [Pokkaliibacter plantistimulans]|uniref:Hydrolase n=1 Tax=Pokkaliibacter plantistimulans TaxID=1635171 RepID=A0ABX5LXS0_9GAMM|nr:serine hydrolase domain-containing protein [Pokkaliibacter plantistimulans]PXF30944.1 hydrolase [Pokkaliibacter plantistimulans]
MLNHTMTLSEHYQLAREMLETGKEVPLPFMKGFPAEPELRVTWSNWMHPPFNRWGFRHLARLRPSISVSAGSAGADVLESSLLPLDSLHFTSTCGEDVTVLEHLLASHTDAFLVMQQGRIVYERYFQGQQANDRHIMFSVTKSLIGLLAEQLISEGKLDDQALTLDYIPELAGSAFADASIRQLLDMAVGIAYSEVYDDPASESSQYGYACGFQPTPSGYEQYRSLYEFLPSLRKNGEHGGFFHYVTATTEVLAWVMERACGQPCARLLEAIWSEIGCQRDGYFLADPWGRNVAGAGFSATLRDMARLGRLIAHQGRYQDKTLISADTIRRIAKGADPAIYAANTEFSGWTPGASYTSQWYVFAESQQLMAGGIHGQYLFIDLQKDIVVVKQSALPTAVGYMDSDSVTMIRTIMKRL